jgi:hypothetical protein
VNPWKLDATEFIGIYEAWVIGYLNENSLWGAEDIL